MLTQAPNFQGRMRIGRELCRKINANQLSLGDVTSDLVNLAKSEKPAWKCPTLPEAFRTGQLHNEIGFYDLLQQGLSGNGMWVPNLQKDILSTVTTTPIFRQDFEPDILPIYLNEFVMYDRIRKVPANGSLHGYIVKTGYGDAQFYGELDTITTDHGQYARVFTPIAICATSRGASLYAQFAAMASQSIYNGGDTPIDMELDDALTAIAHRMQFAMFQGTTAAGHAGDTYGTTNANGIVGMRQIVGNPGGSANAYYPDPTKLNLTIDKSASGKHIDAVNYLVRQIRQRGGKPTAIYCTPLFAERLAQEVPTYLYTMPEQGSIILGQNVTALQTAQGILLPIIVIPGDAIGNYTDTFNGTPGTLVEDAYVGDERALRMYTLGSDLPMIIELPTAHDNNLSKRYIAAQMAGFGIVAPHWWGRVRIISQ